MSSITVRIFDQLSELETISDAWDELALSMGRPPMLSWSWVASHFEYGRPSTKKWLCLAAFDQDTLVGVIPIVPETTSLLGKQVTTLRQPTDPHTRSVDAVIVAGREQEVITAFRIALDMAVPGWFAFELISLDRTSPFVATADIPVENTAIVSVPARYASVCKADVDWESHLKSLSSNFRQRLRKHRKRLAKLGNITTECYSGENVRPDHLDIFMTIEASGWKGRKGSAVGENQQLTKFYRTLLKRLQRRKAVEWHFLKLDDEYIAAHLIIHSGDVRTVWKIGYVEKYSRYSPGALLMEESLHRMYDDSSIRAVDFVTDREWHNSWRPEKNLYYDVWLYPRRPFSIVFGLWPKRIGFILRRVPGLKRAVTILRTVTGQG